MVQSANSSADTHEYDDHHLPFSPWQEAQLRAEMALDAAKREHDEVR